MNVARGRTWATGVAALTRRLRLPGLVLLAALVGAACGNALGPLNAIIGSYTLETWNGVPVPTAVPITSDQSLVPTAIGPSSGSLRLNADSTWRLDLVYYNDEGSGNVITTERTTTGTFTNDNDSLQFTGDATIPFTGTVSGDTLTTVTPNPQPSVLENTIMVFTR